MGTYKSKGIKQDAEKMQILEEEPNYQIKTRSPIPSTWKLNLLRGRREDEMSDEAMPVARRKCINKVREFSKCEKKEGKFWTVFNCQEEYEGMAQCFDWEHKVEMDKRRRDMKNNEEWWWRVLYDQDGEIGDQAQWKGEYWTTLKLQNIYKKFFNTSQDNMEFNKKIE